MHPADRINSRLDVIYSVVFGVLLLVHSGCAPRPYSTGLSSIVLDKEVGLGDGLWRAEAERHIGGDFVVISGHGTSLRINETRHVIWSSRGVPVCTECANEVAWAIEPDKRAFDLTCNADGLTIDTPGAVYAPTAVWIQPDRFWGKDRTDGKTTGDIRDFLVNPWEGLPATRPTTRP